MVGPTGIEPMTNGFHSPAALPLSYVPMPWSTRCESNARPLRTANGTERSTTELRVPNLSQKRKRREVPPELLLPARYDAERHERSVPRRIGLDDAHVGNTYEHEPRCELAELRLVRRREHHRVRPLGEVAGARLPCRVDDLRR